MTIDYNRNTTGEGNTDIELSKIQHLSFKLKNEITDHESRIDTLEANTTIGLRGGVSWVNGEAAKGANQMDATKWLAPITTTIYFVIVHLGSIGTSGRKGNIAIYDDSSGAPSALLGQATEITYGTTETYRALRFTLTTPLSVTAGTVYWTVFNVDTATQIFNFSTVNANGKYIARTYTLGFPATFGVPTGSQFSIAHEIY